MPKPKGRAPRVGQERELIKVVEQSQHGDFYWSLHLLWPNVQPILVRLSRYIGTELCLDGTGKSFLERILVSTKQDIDKAQKEGKIRQKGRDRDLLVFFLRGLLHGVAPIYKYRVSVNGQQWQFGYEGFQHWRSNNQGALDVKELKKETLDEEAEKGILRRIARLILTEKDWAILDDDAERLWNSDGAAADPNEFSRDYNLPENVIPLPGRIN
jgi:hypothetical protein